MALSKSRRFEIFKRDSFTCQYCGQRPDDGVTVLEVDHIYPRAAGGTDDEMNLVTACADCNRGKRAKLLAEVAPRPDADIKTLELQQETAELRRYQASLATKEAALLGVIHSLQDLWYDCAGPIKWHPADHVLRQFLNRYSPEVVESAVRDVAPKVGQQHTWLRVYLGHGGEPWPTKRRAAQVAGYLRCGRLEILQRIGLANLSKLMRNAVTSGLSDSERHHRCQFAQCASGAFRLNGTVSYRALTPARINWSPLVTSSPSPTHAASSLNTRWASHPRSIATW